MERNHGKDKSQEKTETKTKMGRVSQSVEYTAAGALIRYTDSAGEDVSLLLITRDEYVDDGRSIKPR